MRWGNEQRREAMRRSLGVLKQQMKSDNGRELSWIEKPWEFELYIDGKQDSSVRLDDLAAMEQLNPEMWQSMPIEQFRQEIARLLDSTKDS